MSIDHGLHQTVATTDHASGTVVPHLRFGIYSFATAFAYFGDLTDTDLKTRSNEIANHMHAALSRFVYCVQESDRTCQAVVASHAEHESLQNIGDLFLRAGCYADQAASYLGILLDDIAIATAIAVGAPLTKVDSMGQLYRERLNIAALEPIRPLLDEFDAPGGWWQLGFKTKVGARQLLVHNQHLVNFVVRSDPVRGVRVEGMLFAPFKDSDITDAPEFFDLMRNLLRQLFDWLTRLTTTLQQLVSSRMGLPLVLSSRPSCVLPIGQPNCETIFTGDYTMIPLCDGAPPLPWAVR